jgi:hypothetical protein
MTPMAAPVATVLVVAAVTSCFVTVEVLSTAPALTLFVTVIRRRLRGPRRRTGVTFRGR